MSLSPNIETLLWMLLVLAFLYNVFGFSRAIQKGFTRPDGVPLLMRILAVFGLIATAVDAWLLATADLGLAASFCGLFVLAAAQWVFRAAINATTQHKLSLAFSTDAPTHLNETGIYRRVRHPFYLAYTLNWLGAAIASRHWVAFVMLGLMFAFYVAAAWREEQKFLRSSLADSYSNYRHRAGMFFPKPQPQITQNI